MPEELAQRYVELALAGRGSDAVQLLVDPLVTGAITLEVLYERVLTSAAETIGDLWHSTQISVADEHFATQLTQDVVAVAAAVTRSPRDHAGAVVVVACPPDEQHDVGARMIRHLLERQGHDAHVLGASTPIPDLVAYVEKVGADAVALSTASPLSLPGLREATLALTELPKRPRLIVGGRCISRYPDVGRAIGADAVCASAADAAAVLVHVSRAASR